MKRLFYLLLFITSMGISCAHKETQRTPKRTAMDRINSVKEFDLNKEYEEVKILMPVFWYRW